MLTARVAVGMAVGTAVAVTAGGGVTVGVKVGTFAPGTLQASKALNRVAATTATADLPE
jgi:hypothetical protein